MDNLPEILKLTVFISLIIVIFDYFKEVGKKIFYFSCWACILAALFDSNTGGFTNFGNLIGAFLIFMAFNQRRKREGNKHNETEKALKESIEKKLKSYETVDDFWKAMGIDPNS